MNRIVSPDAADCPIAENIAARVLTLPTYYDLALEDVKAIARNVLEIVGCQLEDFVTVSPGCRLGGRSVFRRSVFLGLGVTVIPDIEIGEGAYVAAGAVVTKDVPPRVMVAGVPAVVKRDLL